MKFEPKEAAFLKKNGFKKMFEPRGMDQRYHKSVKFQKGEVGYTISFLPDTMNHVFTAEAFIQQDGEVFRAIRKSKDYPNLQRFIDMVSVKKYFEYIYD